MRYYYDKNGRYVGMSNCGIAPKEAAGSTSAAPEHAGQVWNSEAERWETPEGGDDDEEGEPVKRRGWPLRFFGWRR